MMTRTTLLLMCLCASFLGQMEIRSAEDYQREQFLLADPKVGAMAPGLALCDLKGRPWSLHLEQGRSVLLIKASYT